MVQIHYRMIVLSSLEKVFPLEEPLFSPGYIPLSWINSFRP
ncbi:MAG: hypothetical protein ACRC36_17555 [Lacrimispora sphenoides]